MTPKSTSQHAILKSYGREHSVILIPVHSYSTAALTSASHVPNHLFRSHSYLFDASFHVTELEHPLNKLLKRKCHFSKQNFILTKLCFRCWIGNVKPREFLLVMFKYLFLSWIKSISILDTVDIKFKLNEKKKKKSEFRNPEF